MKKIDVRILTPDGLYKETKASIVNVVSENGQRGILPSHMPIVMTLVISKMELEEETREIYAISGGMLYFNDDKCTILTPAIENQKEIDFDRASSAKDRAMSHLNNPNSDIKRAELALKRAMNRINVYNR